PDQAADQRPFDCRLAFELEAQFDEECLGGFEIVDNDENVIHSLKRHVPAFLIQLWVKNSLSSGYYVNNGWLQCKSPDPAQKKFNCRLVVPSVFRKKPFGENVEGLSYWGKRICSSRSSF